MGTWRDPNREVQQLPDDEFSRDLGGFAPGDPARVHDEDEARRTTNHEALPGRVAELSTDERARLLILAPGTRLAQGSVYLDLDDLDRGAFTAVGGQEAGPRNRYVAKRDVDFELWNRLVGQERDADQTGATGDATEQSGGATGTSDQGGATSAASTTSSTPDWPAADITAVPASTPTSAADEASTPVVAEAAPEPYAEPAHTAAAPMDAAPETPTPTEDEAATADDAPVVTRRAVPAALRSPRNAAAAAAGFGVAALAAVVVLVRGRRR